MTSFMSDYYYRYAQEGVLFPTAKVCRAKDGGRASRRRSFNHCAEALARATASYHKAMACSAVSKVVAKE